MEINPDRFTEVETPKEYVRLIIDFKENEVHTEPFAPEDGMLGFVADRKWFGIHVRNLPGKPSLPSEISVLQSMLEWSPEEWREKRKGAEKDEAGGLDA